MKAPALRTPLIRMTAGDRRAASPNATICLSLLPLATTRRKDLLCESRRNCYGGCHEHIFNPFALREMLLNVSGFRVVGKIHGKTCRGLLFDGRRAHRLP